MYIIALVILIVMLVYAAVIGSPLQTALMLYDIPSLMIIAFISLPMLLASGLFPDLKRAFKVITMKNPVFKKVELQRSLEAVKLTIKLFIFSGVFGFLIGFMNIARRVFDNMEALGPNLSVNTIVLVYALFGCFILLPIQAKLNVMILSAEEE